MVRGRQSVKKFAKLGYPIASLLYYPYVMMNNHSLFSRIPVLMYHKVLRGPIPLGRLHYTVTESTFDLQMRYLAENNYKTLTIKDYIDCLTNAEFWPPKSVLITFDDGYKGVKRVAYPILKKYGFHAAVFLWCDYLGREELFPYDKPIATESEKLNPDLLPLSWADADEIQDVFNIGSHTMSHVLLATLPNKQIQYEIAESKRILEKRLGCEVLAFSYPGGLRQHGSFDSRTRRVLVDSGYKAAFTSVMGRNGHRSDPYLQKRIVVEDGDSESPFSCKLVGSYDWTRLMQWAFHVMYDSPANNRKANRWLSRSS